MKAFWEYRCDEGHAWTVFRDINALEDPSDAICPFGHEAVTLHKSPILDMVQVALRPAARIVDDVKHRIGNECEFYIVITDLRTDVERMSQKRWTWSDAKAMMDRFRLRPDRPGTVSAERAWQILDELDASR